MNVKNWVSENGTAPGTGDVALTGAVVLGDATFLQAFGAGDTSVYYSIESSSGLREAGIGTYKSGTNVLERTTVTATFSGSVYDESSPILQDFQSDVIVRCTFTTNAFDKLLKSDQNNQINGKLELMDGGLVAATYNLNKGVTADGPDVKFSSAGLIAAEATLYLAADSDGSSEAGAIIGLTDADNTTDGVEVFRFDRAAGSEFDFTANNVGLTLKHTGTGSVSLYVDNTVIEWKGNTIPTDNYGAGVLFGRKDGAWIAAEPSLGNPSVSGYVLSSLTNGARSWIEMTGEGGASQLSGLSDVDSAAQTPNFVLATDGLNYYGRALVEADIPVLPYASSTHAASHADGGSDELDVADLASGAATLDQVPLADGAGGVTWGAQSGGAPDLTNATFPTYAIFDAAFAADNTVDFADGNKQVIANATGLSITLAAPGVGSFILDLASNSDLLTAITTPVQWEGGAAPTLTGRSVLAFYYNGSTWVGSAVAGAA